MKLQLFLTHSLWTATTGMLWGLSYFFWRRPHYALARTRLLSRPGRRVLLAGRGCAGVATGLSL